MTTHSMNTTRSDDHSPYSHTNPLWAVGFFAMLLVLVLKVVIGG